jgi:carbamoyltransferase
MNIIGISAHFHDAAACLLQNGQLVAAAEEERFSRIKHDSSLPLSAFRYCLEAGGIAITDIDCIAYYEQPVKKLERQLVTSLPDLPPTRRGSLFRLDPRRPERELREIFGFEGPLRFYDHHLSHAASAYYYSGFKEAATFTVDGVGEWATTSYGRGADGKLELFEEVEFPNSIGLLYSAITGYLGFEINEGEYKVMGLAPYGQPTFVEAIRSLVTDGPDGQFEVQERYLDFMQENRLYRDTLCDLLKGPPRKAESEITGRHRDIARSLQVVLEELLLAKVTYLHRKCPSDNLCLAGGVALNCVANARIVREGPFADVFIQPAAGDAGGALGAAALADAELAGRRSPSRLRHVYWGPSLSSSGTAVCIEKLPGTEDFRGRTPELLERTAELLAAGNVIGWSHGRMEFGPRSLGTRSILADPRQPEMQELINRKIKMREGFRPFAPAVLADEAERHFQLDHPSPFMLETALVCSPIPLPAITHVDGSARVQTVSRKDSPRFYDLIAAFWRRTGCPILLNTSFNVRGEPIVCDHVDALLCFIKTEIDWLVLGDFIIPRSARINALRQLADLSSRTPAGGMSRVYRLF